MQSFTKHQSPVQFLPPDWIPNPPTSLCPNTYLHPSHDDICTSNCFRGCRGTRRSIRKSRRCDCRWGESELSGQGRGRDEGGPRSLGGVSHSVPCACRIVVGDEEGETLGQVLRFVRSGFWVLLQPIERSIYNIFSFGESSFHLHPICSTGSIPTALKLADFWDHVEVHKGSVQQV